MNNKMSKKSEIERILRERFAPGYLEVVDESYKHKGHAGYGEGGESHFKVVISSDFVTGKNRVEKHRAINEALKEIEVHALSIELV